ncbi:alpha-amylase family glycosyl hydrolase [Undibacterium cyanobacteriorum]|uniref:Alpha-amylase family glycosyl hydrolase n=1 Tax=Undibacterium cyanobacteriorum TaxID=3073561 RepID=A0ABY9REV7_9BURK|nr:alpha-amylase family glycosyl hydrolase [Undibacterium sp. 20NA77.5]WMW79761.1 alpha-amylase family glycosyl hydrolase [Undibacterium sp. 20NA77.5]
MPIMIAAHSNVDSSNFALDRTALFDQRWSAHGATLEQCLQRIYGESQSSTLLANMKGALQQALLERADELIELDRQRAANGNWFCQQDMLAYCAYVDRFAGNLNGVRDRIPHLQELGVRYLHLLPFLRARAGENDGGFAVSSFEEVQTELGTVDDLRQLCVDLRAAGISLCSDLVLNHVADDHAWALAAQQGDPDYQAFFHIFENREIPDRYEQSLGQIFPQAAPGNFTWVPGLQRWVWTTFYPFQWDLNYANPQVLLQMVKAMLQLANWGIEAFRLDSTAFLWKRLGTNCMNQEEAHWILQAMRAVVQMVCPAVLLKAEAIVPTADLPPYLGDSAKQIKECHIAYHSSLMAASWVALAEQRNDALLAVFENTPSLPEQTTWLNYVRCHDDIGWNVLRAELNRNVDRNADETKADQLGVKTSALQRLQAASNFYSEEENSFADGRRFQASDPTAVHGTVGMAASLCGVHGLELRGNEMAVRRLLMLYSLAFSFGGMPLLYMGDELGQTNELDYQNDPQRRHDARWLQRPFFDVQAVRRARHDDGQSADANITVSEEIFQNLRRLIQQRRALPALAAHASRHVVNLNNPAVLGFVRRRSEADHHQDVFCLFNFSENEQIIAAELAQQGMRSAGLVNSSSEYDLQQRRHHSLDPDSAWYDAERQIKIAPYSAIWFYA